MRWHEIAISDLGRIVTGKTPETKHRDFYDGEIPFITPSDIGFNHYVCRATGTTVTDRAKEKFANQFIPAGSVVVTCIGNTIGKVTIAERESLTNQQMNSIVVSDDHDETFVYYLMCHNVERIRGIGLGGGAATPILNKSTFSAIRVRVPVNKEVEESIASILRNYDDLIANNKRRIQLLEQSARLLFKEWFVHLRYPGNEHDKIVDGVPVGWERKTLEALCVDDGGIQTGPFGSQLHEADYTDEGIPVVMPKDLIGFRINERSIARIPESLADGLRRHRMEKGDVVYGRRGDIGRRAFISDREKGFLCGTGCLRLRPDANEIDPRYFFYMLGHPVVAGTIAGRAKGATMPNLNATILCDVTMMVAPASLQQDFVEWVQIIDSQIALLEQQVGQLARARDLLLPRLMDGRLTV